jgi:hypothetical protein
MSLSKYRLKLPELKPEECRGIEMQEALEEIKYSRHCLVIYEPHRGPTEVLLTGLNKELFASILALLCQHPELLQFLKLLVIATEKVLKYDKRGMSFAEQISDWIEKNLSEVTPKTEK